ncbi:hypothetical protein F2Q68_00036248 [Brassica cretica]|uniref:Uncharacterized protein n=1 Tax=Brassica cretica TaxID=69181 RepID=A0A8S9GU77_BRACR|nr:hypothetical protein F2Q68_00036248 [Brassica cretica]
MNVRGDIPTKFSLGIFRGHFRQTSGPRNFLGSLFLGIPSENSEGFPRKEEILKNYFRRLVSSVPIFRDWFSVSCVGSSVGAFKIVVFSILVLVWYGVVCIFGLFSATVKCPEDHWFAICFAPVKSSELKCVVPRSVVWSGGWTCFYYFAWLSRISGVGGLSSLEAHPRCVWLSPYKLLVVLSFMANISSFLNF